MFLRTASLQLSLIFRVPNHHRSSSCDAETLLQNIRERSKFAVFRLLLSLLMLFCVVRPDVIQVPGTEWAKPSAAVSSEPAIDSAGAEFGEQLLRAFRLQHWSRQTLSTTTDCSSGLFPPAACTAAVSSFLSLLADRSALESLRI